MSFNAGSIDARMTLDRSEFSRELRAAKSEAEAFARNPISVRMRLETGDLQHELELLRVKLDLATRDREINIRTNQGGLNDLENRLNRLGDTSTRTTNRIVRNNKEAAGSFNLIRVAAELLLAPAVVAAGGLAAIGAGAATMGIAGVLAFKGIAAEMKAGTDQGAAYGGMLRSLKDSLASAERTSADGLFAGAQASVEKLMAELPGFNAEMAISSRNLGSIASHLTGAMVGGFSTFGPLINDVERYVDGLAAKFEQWATGPGGASFAETLRQDFEKLQPFLAQVGTLVVHLLSALNGVGGGQITALTSFIGLLNKLPVPVIEAATVAYLAFRAATAVTAGIDAASAALLRFGAASAAAGAGGAGGAAGGARGRIAGVLGVLGPVTAAYAAVTIGVTAAANATNKWQESTNKTKSVLSNTLAIVKDIATFQWSKVPDEYAHQMAAYRAASDQRYAQAQINRYTTGVVPNANNMPGTRQVADPLGSTGAARAHFEDMQRLAEQKQALGKTIETVKQLKAKEDELTGTQARLAAAGQQGTIAYKINALALSQLNKQSLIAIGQWGKAETAYNTLKATTSDYTKMLREQQAEFKAGLAVQEKTAKSYADNQQRLLQGQIDNVFKQNTGLTNGVQGLQAYASSLDKTIKAEESWTKVTDDHTVKIKGVTYEQKALASALEQTGGDYNKAIGLLQGHTMALANDKALAAQVAEQQTRLSAAIGAAEAKYKLSDAQLQTYASAMGITSEQLAKGTVSQDVFTAAVGRVKGVIDQGNTAMQGWVEAVTQFQTGADTAASRAQLMGAAMVALQGDAISWQGAMAQSAVANQQFVTDLGKVKKGVLDLKTGTIDYHNAASAPLLNDLAQMQASSRAAAQAVYQHEVSIKGQTQAAKDATDVFYNNTHGALIAEAAQLGLTQGQAKKLADTYFNWPKDAKTQIAALGAASTNDILTKISNILTAIAKRWGVDVAVSSNSLEATTAVMRNLDTAIAYYKANPAIIKVGYQYSSRDPSAENVSRGGGRNSALGNLFTAYAGGGVENHYPQIATPGANRVRVWAEPETRGEAYIPLANDHRRPRARQIASETVRLLGGIAAFESGGFTGVVGSSGSSSSSSRSGSSSGGSGSTSHKSGISASTLAADARIAALLNSIYGGINSSTELSRLAKSSTSAIQSWISKLTQALSSAQNAKLIPSSLVTQFKKDNTALQAALKTRDAYANALKASNQKLASDRDSLKSYGASVTQTVLGGFDVTSSGNGYAYGIKASLKQQIADQTKAAALVSRAKAMHLDPRLVEQFEAKGPEGLANLEAITNAGQSYVNSLNADYSKLSGLATAAGNTAMKDNVELNKQIAADNKTIAAQTKAMATAQTAANRALKAIQTDIHRVASTSAAELAALRKKA